MPKRAKPENLARTARRALADKPPKRERGQATITGDIRECIENAFHKLGGVAYLKWVGERRPDVFLALLAKVLPSEARLTVMAGYQAIVVPVEQRDPIPAPAPLEALPGPSPQDPLRVGPSGPYVVPQAVDDGVDWLE